MNKYLTIILTTLALSCFTYAGPCEDDPDCIFATAFDGGFTDWEGCAAGNCGAGHACFVASNGTGPAQGSFSCADHPMNPGNCTDCDPQPVTYSPYLSAPVVSPGTGRACRVQALDNDGRTDYSGTGKMLVNYMGSSGASFNDCVFMKVFDDGADGGVEPDQYSEIWQQFSFRVTTDFKTAMEGTQSGGGDDMKFGRVGHHAGDFTSTVCNQWFGFNNSPHCDAFGLWNIRQSGGAIRQVNAPRCQTTYRPCDSQSEYGGANAQIGASFETAMDGNWHTITTKHKVNSSTTEGGGWDGEFYMYIDGSTTEIDGGTNTGTGMAGVSYFDGGWAPNTIPGWNWSEIGGNSRITHSEGVISTQYDNWCIATTRAAAEACHNRLTNTAMLGQATATIEGGHINGGSIQ